MIFKPEHNDEECMEEPAEVTGSYKNENIAQEIDELPLKERVIYQISSSEAVVKSQQRYEPDLTFEERKIIVNELLEKSPSQFLYRFGKYLKIEQLQYFDEISDDPDIFFYIKETQKVLNEDTKRTKIKNRRYGALRKMQASSSYFSSEEMRKRNPRLYDELIDKNLTSEEKSERDQTSVSNCDARSSFSGLLFEQFDRNLRNKQCKREEESEKDCIVEFEDSDSDDEEAMMEEPEFVSDPLEKELLKNEFDSSLYCQFLTGKDPEVDYKAIDESEEYDLLEHEMQDAEEKYFDEEDENLVAEEDVSNFNSLRIS